MADMDDVEVHARQVELGTPAEAPAHDPHLEGLGSGIALQS